MPKQVRVRFAPSPTGFLHIGGVRTALFNYLFAKQKNGQFILRLEDTDRERFVPEGIEQIKQSLNWLGLSPDETYQQSQRHQELDIYQKYAAKLVKLGLAYYSPTSKTTLDKLREKAKKNKTAFLYKKTDDTENTSEILENTPMRLDVAATVDKLGLDKTITWSEPTGRRLDWQLSLIDDFILIKSDGYPTYNFANVVDDQEMQISHVLRGDEFIASTQKHILLYKALGLSEPIFVHLPVINGSDGKKLSKRTGDTNVLDYRDKGYLPEALLNFLALLGWNDGTEQEIFSMNELVAKFSLERINTSPATFDPERLRWMNGLYVRKIDKESYMSSAKKFIPQSFKKLEPKILSNVLLSARDRIHIFSDLNNLATYIVNPPTITNEKIDHFNKKFQLECREISLKNWLETVINEIDNSDAGNVKQLMDKLRNEADKYESTNSGLFWIVLREFLTGEDKTPSIGEIVQLELGKEESIKRLEAIKNKL